MAFVPGLTTHSGSFFVRSLFNKWQIAPATGKYTPDTFPEPIINTSLSAPTALFNIASDVTKEKVVSIP